MRALAALLLMLGCGPPQRPLPPPLDGPGDCRTAAENLQRLGGCGLDPARVEQDCRDAEEAEADVGVRLPVGCLTAATTCDDAAICR
jgi:hypothetical protein